MQGHFVSQTCRGVQLFKLRTKGVCVLGIARWILSRVPSASQGRSQTSSEKKVKNIIKAVVNIIIFMSQWLKRRHI